MENLNIDVKKFSEYIVNLIYGVNDFDINDISKQKVSPLRLQNILYCAYAWALVTWDKKLWSNNFEKWTIGPVIPEIYYDYSKNGVRLFNWEKHFIKFPELKNIEKLDLEILIADINAKYNDIELVKLINNDVWKNTKANSIIKSEDIIKYYSEDNNFLDKIMYDPSLKNDIKFFS